jgi:hypothetical protein
MLDHELNSEDEDLLEELDSQSDDSDKDDGPCLPSTIFGWLF